MVQGGCPLMNLKVDEWGRGGEGQAQGNNETGRDEEVGQRKEAVV